MPENNSSEKKDEDGLTQDERDELYRQKFEYEMDNYDQTSNKILDGVREKGVSISTSGDKKHLPEMITDIHILYSRQKPEFVFEGVDTSDDLVDELNGEDNTVEEGTTEL